jgi:hypothetical protein
MNILFHVSTPGGGALLLPLAQAAQRAGTSFAAFFTHEGVLGLKTEALVSALKVAERAVVCEESWHRFCPSLDCPVEYGSQTINSGLMAKAVRVVAL